MASFSNEDKERTQLYQDETKRITHKQESRSEEEFFKNLGMTSTVKRFDEYGIPRVAQLLQRSNQFNLRTIRYFEEELIKISNSEEYIPLYLDLSDTYGAYGLIAVVILQKQSDSLFIDTWAMSCRILKRGMEEFIMNHLILIAQDQGFMFITGEYIPTAKNGIVKELYSTLNFKPKNTIWELEVENHKELPTFIALK